MDGWMVSFIRRWFVAGESHWWCLSIGSRAATTDVLNEYSSPPPVRVFRVRLRLDQCVYHAIEKPFFVFVSSTSTSPSFALEIDQISQPVSRHLSFIKLWLEPSGRHLLFNGIQLEMMSSNVNRKILFSNLSYRSNEQTLIRYFSFFGSIEEICLDRDDQEQSLREGFLVYSDGKSIDLLMSKRPHTIDERIIHLQRFIPPQCVNPRNFADHLGIHLTVNEIFLHRLNAGETREMFVNYFQQFGPILDCRVCHSTSNYGKSNGYAFVRFSDYDSVGKVSSRAARPCRNVWRGISDRVILSRPHRINSRIYPLRKCIPREFNYIISSTRPLSANKSIWRHYAIGLINTKTETIVYPTLAKPTFVAHLCFFFLDDRLLSFRRSTVTKTSSIAKPCSVSPLVPVTIDTTPTRKNNEFELVTAKSISSDSISIVNSTGNFTPLASPLYSTAIAYSSPTDLHCRPNSNNSFLLAMVDHHDKQSFEIIWIPVSSVWIASSRQLMKKNQSISFLGNNSIIYKTQVNVREMRMAFSHECEQEKLRQTNHLHISSRWVARRWLVRSYSRC